MELFAALAGAASMLVSCIVGTRLVMLSRRTHQAPELLVGITLVLAGGAWSALVAVGRQATGLPDETRIALVLAGALCGLAGMTCMAVFTWRVFRPVSAWAACLAAAVALSLLGIFAAQAFAPGWLVFVREERGPWTAVMWIAALNYCWAFLESRRQHAMLVRRLRLGLADPVVTDRMRLWTLIMATSMLASIFFASCQTLGIPMGGTPFGLNMAALVALLTAGLLWLAFMPPASYLDSVRRRAPVEA